MIDSPTERDRSRGRFVGNCCWCGGPADSDEDVVSQWIEREIAPDPATVVGNPTLRTYDHGRVRHQPVQRLATKKIRVRAVCKACNNGWMSAQERKVKPLLAPLIRGHRRTLNLSDQIEIAGWGCIKAVVCDTRPNTSDGGLVSEASLRAIYEERRPADDMVVRLAAYEAAFGIQVLNPFGMGTGSAGQPLAQWATTMVLGHLVMQIFGRTGSVLPPVLDQNPQGVHDGQSFTVWPPQPGPVQWPPPQVLAAEKLGAFCDEMLPPELEVPTEALLNDPDVCPRCGDTHGPFVRELPVPELPRVEE